MQIILASGSPRRRELISLFGIPFTVAPADIDETMDPRRSPAEETARVSRLKALASECGPDDLIIAADTVVVCDGRILGKPADRAEAVRMLRMLSGRKHQVMTGCTIRRQQEIETFTEVTDVYFRELTEEEILRYVASGEPMDKAGAYGIQGGAALFCSRIEGDYYNVVGLPVCALWSRLQHCLHPQIGENL